MEVSEGFHLEQIVSEPKRLYNILDLCFTSHPNAVISSQTSPGLSEHEVVVTKFTSRTCLLKKSSRKIHFYNKANWDKISSNLLHILDTYFELNFNSLRSS